MGHVGVYSIFQVLPQSAEAAAGISMLARGRPRSATSYCVGFRAQSIGSEAVYHYGLFDLKGTLIYPFIGS